MTKILSGIFKGRRLQVPLKGTRPTSEKVREAIFSVLLHQDALEDALVLDLYAGTGAIGIEALSRGAKQVTFVEKSASAARTLSTNITSLGLESVTEIHNTTVNSWLSWQKSGTNNSNLPTQTEQASVPETDIETVSFVELKKTVPLDRGKGFHIIFLDPPYDLPTPELDKQIIKIASLDLLIPDGVIVLERSKRSSKPSWPRSWQELETRIWGETVCYLAERPFE